MNTSEPHHLCALVVSYKFTYSMILCVIIVKVYSNFAGEHRVLGNEPMKYSILVHAFLLAGFTKKFPKNLLFIQNGFTAYAMANVN